MNDFPDIYKQFTKLVSSTELSKYAQQYERFTSDKRKVTILELALHYLEIVYNKIRKAKRCDDSA